jgi:TonB family protein
MNTSRLFSVVAHILIVALILLLGRVTHRVVKQQYQQTLVFPVHPIRTRTVSVPVPVASLTVTRLSIGTRAVVKEQHVVIPEPVKLDVSNRVELPQVTQRIVVESPQVRTVGFTQPAASVVSSNRQAAGSVSAAGFGQLTAGTVSSNTGGVVTQGGFGTSTGQASRSNVEARVVAAGFSVATAPGLHAVATSTPSAPTPPVILSEANPIFTDAARAERISGTVVLRVRFTAEGSVKVLGVLQGLGYGLDESAIRTAETITFTPAKQGGQPVSFDTTARITFQMP